MPRSGLTIGQVSQRTGLSPKAIRIYERKGLLPTTNRTSSGYRIFLGDDIDVLRFIRQARSIGLRLDEIKDVLDLQRSGQKPCETVIAMLDAHITEIDRALADLTSLRSTLANACAQARASRDRGEGGVICEIIESQDGITDGVDSFRDEVTEDSFSPHSHHRFSPSGFPS
jgi:DNA-binding transcriptional MerR regulator